MGENRDFWRRSWRRHPALTAAQLACCLGVCVTGVVRIVNGHSLWSTGLELAFLAGGVTLGVMLVRRDDS
jgi:hypothetical protein